MMSTTSEQAWVRLLGPRGPQHLRASQAFLSLTNYLIIAVLLFGEVRMGMIEAVNAWWLIGFSLAGGLGFFGLIRSGLNLRLHPQEPALTQPQMLFAMVSVCWAYSIAGPARGAVLMIMILILIQVYGIFILKAQQARVISLAGLVMLTVAVAAKSSLDPAHYDLRIEVLHLLFAAVTMAMVQVLAGRLSRLRQRLRDQKGELAEALARLEVLAMRDPLTGLLNRRSMMDLLAHEARAQVRHGQPMSLVLVDLDHFKQINDGHGHAVGDQVLHLFAQQARAKLRGGDVIARWGGEEFLLMLPRTGAHDAIDCVQRLREDLTQLRFPGAPPGLRVTFSAGLAECWREPDIQAAIEQADQAMYRAKAAGRDRTVGAPSRPLAAAEA
jgi:diguanylate cyclase (GGDEF)-like protein